MVRVYADGVFDLFHYGHARLLEQAKNTFDDVYLIVGVNSDEDTIKHKGITVMTFEERCECVRHCKWVDEVIYDAPWVVTAEFIEKHGIDYVAHDGDPYPVAGGEVDDIYAVPKAMGKFLSTSRTDGISTTELIQRILSHNASFVERNASRLL
jgi:choline-phosphate cytidylyltransferase